MGCCKVRLRVDEDGVVALNVAEQTNVTWSGTEYIPYRSTEYPDWDGTYNVVPRLSPQVLNTTDHIMRDDLTVEGIPTYRTTNPSGGYTVIISQD